MMKNLSLPRSSEAPCGGGGRHESRENTQLLCVRKTGQRAGGGRNTGVLCNLCTPSLPLVQPLLSPFVTVLTPELLLTSGRPKRSDTGYCFDATLISFRFIGLFISCKIPVCTHTLQMPGALEDQKASDLPELEFWLAVNHHVGRKTGSGPSTRPAGALTH